MSKYKKSEFKRVSWEEYGKILDIIYKKVSAYLKENNIQVDAVIPILRGGAVAGIYLAYRLNQLRILPVQYHYFFGKGKTDLSQILDFPQMKLPKNPTFLLVEGNHCFGLTAQTVVKDLKKEFSGCKIIYVADHLDYSYQKMEGVEVTIYGKLTDETRNISQEDAKRLGIEKNTSYLFPWEKLEEEWATVSGKQFEYQDINEIINASKIKSSMQTKEYFKDK